MKKLLKNNISAQLTLKFTVKRIVTHRRGFGLCVLPTKGSSKKNMKAFVDCCRLPRWHFKIGKRN